MPQVTKTPKGPSRPLQTGHLTALNAAHLAPQKQDREPSMAIKGKQKEYKSHPGAAKGHVVQHKLSGLC